MQKREILKVKVQGVEIHLRRPVQFPVDNLGILRVRASI